MNIEIGKELVAMADILERSGGSGDIIAYKGEVLVVENVIDDPEELDFVATVSLKYNKSVTPFVVRGDEVKVKTQEDIMVKKGDKVFFASADNIDIPRFESAFWNCNSCRWRYV